MGRIRFRPEEELQIEALRHLQFALPKTAFLRADPNGFLDRRRVLFARRVGVKFGVPDVEILVDGMSYQIEFKTKGQHLSTKQKETHELLRLAKVPVATCYGMDDVDEFLDVCNLRRGRWY